jgi:hypothetical protein
MVHRKSLPYLALTKDFIKCAIETLSKELLTEYKFADCRLPIIVVCRVPTETLGAACRPACFAWLEHSRGTEEDKNRRKRRIIEKVGCVFNSWIYIQLIGTVTGKLMSIDSREDSPIMSMIKSNFLLCSIKIPYILAKFLD